MARHTVPANEVAIKALRCPEGKARIVYHVDGRGNDGLKLYVESSGTKTWCFRARVRGSDPKDMPLGRWPDVTIADAPQPDIEATVAAATKEVYTFSCASLSFVQ
jgi:Arm DNA-binding domain